MEYCCVDVETTGLDPANEEIVEVCAITFNDSGQILQRFQRYCEPIKGAIPIEASNIHSITMEKVAEQKHYMDIREELAAFIGDRTVIGHNVIEFDLKFLKIVPKAAEDTLMMCRKIWPGKNNLTNACKRVGIKFEPDKAHGAGYDVEKTIELYLTLKAMDKKEPTLLDAKSLHATQAYSFSRINLFHQCPWKWYRVYVLKQKESSTPMLVGNCLHLIAQISAMWCYAKSFANRFEVYIKKEEVKSFKDVVGQAMRQAITDRTFYLPQDPKDVTVNHIGMFTYMNMGYCQSFFGITMSELINRVTVSVSVDEFAKIERPPAEVYSQICQRAIAKTRITDAEALVDIRFLSEYFYGQNDFIIIDGTVSVVEQRLCYDDKWQRLSDFFDDKAFFRGVLDIIEYNGDSMVTITDYKSGRKMLNQKQLQEDRQLLIYVFLVHLLLPTVSTIRIRQHYIRFGQVIELDITNVSEVAEAARAWIMGSISEIEATLQNGEKAFTPNRNQFCGSCSYMENGECPLFNIKHINDITDPANFVIKSVDDVAKAYKKIEVNQAEISALTKKCKEFVHAHHQNIVIDGKATLDFWIKEGLEYDAVEVAKLLVKKNVPMSGFLQYFSLPKTGWEKIEKMLKKNDVEITADELGMVTAKTKKTSFLALTREEVEADDYVNVKIDQPAKEVPGGSTKA